MIALMLYFLYRGLYLLKKYLFSLLVLLLYLLLLIFHWLVLRAPQKIARYKGASETMSRQRDESHVLVISGF